MSSRCSPRCHSSPGRTYTSAAAGRGGVASGSVRPAGRMPLRSASSASIVRSRSSDGVSSARSAARVAVSASAIAPNGSSVARTSASSAGERSTSVTGNVGSPRAMASSTRRCPSMRLPVVTFWVTEATSPTSSIAPASARCCACGWRRKLRGFGVRVRGSRSACPTMRLRHGTGAEFRTRPLECRRGRALVVLAGSSTADVGTSGGRYTSAPPGPLEGAGRCVMEEAGVVDGRSCRVSDYLGSTGRAGGPPTLNPSEGGTRRQCANRASPPPSWAPAGRPAAVGPVCRT